MSYHVPLLTARKNHQTNKLKQVSDLELWHPEFHTSVLRAQFLLEKNGARSKRAIRKRSLHGSARGFNFWFGSESRTAQRLKGLSWCAGGRTAEPHKNQNKTLRKLYWFRLERLFFGFSLFFRFWIQKKTCVFCFLQVHGWRQSPKNKKHQMFLFLFEFKTKKTGKTTKTFFESKPKSFLKIFCFSLMLFVCLVFLVFFVFYLYCFFTTNNKLSPTQDFLQQTLVFQ